MRGDAGQEMGVNPVTAYLLKGSQGGMLMIEYDDEGNEWFGYAFSSEENDPAAVISVFLGSIQYAEWSFRQIVSKPRQCSLASQLQHLFDLLPNEAERAITDDRSSLIGEIVRTRNRYAHGKFDEAPPSTTRVHTLSLKVAALLSFSQSVHEGRPDDALSMAKSGSPYLRQQLEQTDIPR
jgi:hypothetical protein